MGSLQLASTLFIPVALALTLSLLLAPLVNLLQRKGLPNVPAVLVVVLLFTLLVAGVGFLVTQQAIGVSRELPNYRENIQKKVSSLRGPMSHAFTRVQETVREVKKSASEASPLPAAPPPSGAVKVQVVDQEVDPIKVAGGAASLVRTACVTFLVLLFLLLYRSEIADRAVRLLGHDPADLTTQTIRDSAAGVSRYLSTQALVNGSYGAAIMAGLLLLGVPNAPLWGLLAGLLRFFPYVGAVTGAFFPVLLAVAIFDGWTRPLLTLGLFVVLELLVAYLIEPLAYGARTGLSPLAIILAAVFWSWLWGWMGLLLTVPITVCLATIGKNVPKLGFLTLLMASDPQAYLTKPSQGKKSSE